MKYLQKNIYNTTKYQERRNNGIIFQKFINYKCKIVFMKIIIFIKMMMKMI